MEIWKDITGYEGLYQVSNLGNVRSLDMLVNNCGDTKSIRKGRILKKIDVKGYDRVNLYKDGKNKSVYVHKLVLNEFNPNPDPQNFTDINHINEDKKDNRLCNLEWCNHHYNLEYGTRIERMVDTKVRKGIWNPDLIGLGKKEYMRQYMKNYKKVVV